MALEPGIARAHEFTVEGRLLTDVGGTIGVSVLSTPGMISMMERNATMLAYPELPEGKATVGFEVCVKHVAGALEGARCTAHAELKEIVDGRKLRFHVEVREGEPTIGTPPVPVPPSQKQLDAWQAAGAEPNERPRTRFRLGPVWDRSQVEPLPPPAEPVALDPPITEPDGDSLAWTQPQLKALVKELGCTLVFEDHHTDLGGFFAPSTKMISINSAHAVNDQVKTLIHELAHALMHLADPNGPALSYAEEEIVVESIAFSVVGGLGIDTSGYSIPYLTSWSQDDADMEIVEACAELIDRRAKRIENAIGDPPNPTATSETA